MTEIAKALFGIVLCGIGLRLWYLLIELPQEANRSRLQRICSGNIIFQIGLGWMSAAGMFKIPTYLEYFMYANWMLSSVFSIVVAALNEQDRKREKLVAQRLEKQPLHNA